MKNDQLKKTAVVGSVFVVAELIVLAVITVITLSNDGTSAWGYWGAVAAVFVPLSPIYVYVIASVVFYARQLFFVWKKPHTPESLKQHYKTVRGYFIWGIVTGSLYGFILAPIFLLENIFLLIGYKKELARSEEDRAEPLPE